MGLFSKKTCDICGKKSGLFGNRKLEDGNICSDCASRLSFWFDDRRHSTLAEIREQLAYREENQKAVEAFQCTEELGEHYFVRFDDHANTFMVTNRRDEESRKLENPDVFKCTQVKDARLDIQDTRTELYTTDREGNRESYDPPRYEYHFRFYIEITLDHPYVDQIRFQLNESPLDIQHTDRGFSLFSSNEFIPSSDYDYKHYQSMGEAIVRKLKKGAVTYVQEEPEKVSADQPREEPEDPQMMFCPYCGSRIRKAKFCTNCGANIQ